VRRSVAIFLCCLGVTFSGYHAYAAGLSQVKTHFLKGEYGKAIGSGEEIISRSMDKTLRERDQLYYFMGLSYLQEADYTRAADMFEFVIDELVDSDFVPEAKLGMADIAYRKSEYSGARDLYRDLLSGPPKDDLIPVLYSRLSLCAAKLDKIEEAQQYADILKKDYPESLEIALGDNLFNTGAFYTVQIGAFSDQGNAQGLKEELLLKDYPAYIEELSQNGSLTYRVRIGKLKSRGEASRLKEKLRSDDYPAKIFP